MTYLDIARGQYMEKEPPDKFLGLQCHGFLTVPVGIISPEKRNLAVPVGELREGLGGRPKKQVVQELRVHRDQGIQCRGEGEDHMEVFNGQEVLPASLDPFFFS